MQMLLGFGAVEDMEWVRDRLRARFGQPGPILVRKPVDQLVKSLISGRTRDEVSFRAFRRLVDAYPDWSDVVLAPAPRIEAIIRDVTFPERKARQLGGALAAIAASRPDFDLMFLGPLGVPAALRWLENLPGVGRKVAASTLNFSTLRMPAFVVDTHVLRILGEFGFVRSSADTRTAYDRTMEMLPGWSAADLADLHVLMKKLGQDICVAGSLDCPRCPIVKRCEASAAGLRLPPDGIAR